jgi:FSR family fosmidomycin resistance protein-like MFS transporter
VASIGQQRRGLGYVATFHGLVHVLELSYGVVLVAIADDLGVTLLTLGVLANVFGLAYGATALPVGVLTDRLSGTRLLGACALAVAAAALLVAASRGTISLGVGMCALGVALGIFHPVAMTYVSRISTNIGLGYAYLGTGGNIGLAFGPLLAGAIASGLGWRFAYGLMAIPALVIAFLFFRLSQTTAPVARAGEQDREETPPSLRPYLIPLGIVLVVGLLNGLIYRGIVTFLPLHLSESVGRSIGNLDAVMLAGSFTTIALLFGVIGQFLGGYLSDRHKREWLAVISTVVSVPALLAVWSLGGITLLAFAGVLAFFHFLGQPVFNALIADYCPDCWRGRMFGFYFFCTFGVGSFSASFLGYVAEQQNVAAVFFVCAIIAVLAAGFTLPLLVRAYRREQTVRPAEPSVL